MRPAGRQRRIVIAPVGFGKIALVTAVLEG